ncbi:flagellar basal body rod protein FlgC [Paenibacillus sonchi]|uniref:Flagellar basal-body rod protein FlgC n=2 Tax=Paenibacillus sonchi group TaxID=2044880 RepID=A0A974PAM5_9BACL|nr:MULTISPECIES: flagellar basal body rod protein FlgC [Paenibacillus sonchi group]MCE3201547.1 flagellar basal body rod protein FlgC [Paenibacillus sonchi]QQZ60345.1 flagellar basal body rod protein FlgC [Paenibacillus sonchi]CQR56482.1 flagellar basal-body rod protein flgC [Paenibacillus riograndensis SBR5]
MNFGSSFGISASALTAQRLRMDVISSNIANAETTRASVVDGKAVPYRRKLVVLETNQNDSFSNILNSKMNSDGSQGVKVQSIIEDSSPLKPVYNPSHPDADADGYVYMPNVDITKEMVDMLSASRSYDANVTMLNASKGMVTKALEIGR